MCLREVCAETGDIQSTECTSLPHSLELAFQTHLLRGGCRPHPVCVCVCEGGRGEGGREVLERKGNTSNGHDHLHSNSHTWGHTSLPPHLTHTGSHLPPSSPHTHRVTPPSPPHLASDDDIDGTLQNDIPAASLVSLVEHWVEGKGKMNA